MKPIKRIRKTVISSMYETKSVIRIGNNTYLIKRHFLGRRDVAEAINTIVKNEAVR